ncbi:Hypothetical predicted protein [Olea europaea subsp. europaea]|uniref:Uncharacterized protein n=1 Tax=Olea europaea subsp. europaea TaxID=158383 RepID=A0A8S0V4F0_OLEEU|nr:Hypothetical predicted protein [Olea europaea subsp. europaea]
MQTLPSISIFPFEAEVAAATLAKWEVQLCEGWTMCELVRCQGRISDDRGRPSIVGLGES